MSQISKSQVVTAQVYIHQLVAQGHLEIVMMGIQREPFVAAHNIILSHAAAVDIFRSKYQVGSQSGNIDKYPHFSIEFYVDRHPTITLTSWDQL